MTQDAGTPDRLLAEAIARQTAGDLAAALTLYRRALCLAPWSGPAWRFLSHALHIIGRTDSAGRAAARGIVGDPADPVAHMLRGYAAMRVAGSGARWFRRALALSPGYFPALANLAAGGDQTDGPAYVAQWAGRALAIDDGSPEARLTRANALLALGHWRAAWPDHELRLSLQGSYPHRLVTPRWTGAPAPTATLLVHDEIGYGDVFNHARYLALARSRVGRLVLEVKPGLARLLQGYGEIDQVIERGAAPPAIDHDFHLPIESLPGLFGTTPDQVPSESPPPLPPPDVLARWRAAFPPSPRLRVGLVWAGSAESGLDRTRSCRLSDLAPLGALAGIEWISLQRGPATAQIAEFAKPLADIGSAVEDFADTAAVILQLDAVVTVDTAVAHLSGVLGCPTLVLLSRWPPWRWLLDRADSPWYRAAELYRQCVPGAWETPVAQIAARLEALRDAKAAS